MHRSLIACLLVVEFLSACCCLGIGGGETSQDPISLATIDKLIRTVKIHIYKPPCGINMHMGQGARSREVYLLLETRLHLELQRLAQANVVQVVTDPAEADFFLVPHALMTHVHLAQSLKLGIQPSPDMAYQGIMRYMRHSLEPFLLHIVHDLPFYNASAGRNHIFVYLWDNGPTCDGVIPGQPFESDLWQKDARAWQDSKVFKAIVHPMIIVGYHGSSGFNAPPGRSTVRSRCFWVDHDITLPQYNLFQQLPPKEKPIRVLGPQYIRQQSTLHHGNLYYKGTEKPGVFCSPNIRFQLHDAIGPTRTYSQHTRGQCDCQHTWAAHPAAAVYGLCPAGWGCWSLRFYHMLHLNVIPVIMADGIVQPFERFLDYTQFTVKRLSGASEVVQRQLQVLHESAVSFRQACMGCGPSGEARLACDEHPVAKKLVQVHRHAPWFSWATTARRNVYKLFLLELYCRKEPSHTDVCGRRSSSIALAEWW